MRRRLGISIGFLVLGAFVAFVAFAGSARAAAPAGRVVAIEGGLAEVVIDPSGSRAYVTNPDHGRVEVVVLATGARETPIAVGDGPAGLDFSADGRFLYVANARAHEISVVDVALRAEVRRIAVPGGRENTQSPLSIAVARNGTALVTTTFPGTGSSPLYQLDLASGAVTPRIDIWTPTNDSRVVASGDRSRIGLFHRGITSGPVALYDVATDAFVGKELSVLVHAGALDGTGSKVVTGPYVMDTGLVLRATVPFAHPASVTLNATGTTGYWVEQAKVNVVDVSRGLATGTIALPDPLGDGPGTSALSPNGSTLAIVTESGLSIVPTNAVTPTPCDPPPARPGVLQICGGRPLTEVVVDAAGRYAYAANTERNQIEVVSLTDRRLLDPIPVGSRPVGLDFSPDGTRLYVANSGAAEVSVVDVLTRRELRRVTAPTLPGNVRPFSIAVGDHGRALVTTHADGEETTRLLKMDLGTERLYAAEPPDWFGRELAGRSRVDASGDRSVIGVVDAHPFEAAVLRYDAATDSFGPEKEMGGGAKYVALDYAGSTMVVDGYAFLDEANVMRATMPGGGDDAALNGPGTRAYRSVHHVVDVIDVARGLVIGSFGMPEGLGDSFGAIALTPDESTVVALTATGISIVAVNGPLPPSPCVSTVAAVCGAPLVEVIVDPTGARAYASNPSRNQLEVLSMATGQLEASIPVGSQPRSIDFSADGRLLYVANSGANDLSVVDLASRREVRRITVPAGRWNERPYSIAVANNGKAILTRTSHLNFGSIELLELDLASETFRVLDPNGPVSPYTHLAASGDRSWIALAYGIWEGGAVVVYSAATGSIVSGQAFMNQYVDSVAVDRTGATYFAGRFVLDASLEQRAVVSGDHQPGVALSSDGRRGYRMVDGRVEIIDTQQGVVISSTPLPDRPAQGNRSLRLTPDDRTLLVVTLSGIAVVPVNGTTPETPHSVWAQPGTGGVDGLGTWMVAVNDPGPASYLYAHLMGFTNSRAMGVIGLGTGPNGKYAQFAVRDDGEWRGVAVPFDWQANRFYYPLVHQLGPGQWGAWVYDHTAGAWVPIGQLNLPLAWGKLAPQSVTAVMWTGPRTEGCAAVPRADVLVHPPVGYRAGVATVAKLTSNGEQPGDCPADVSTVAGGWARYQVGAA